MRCATGSENRAEADISFSSGCVRDTHLNMQAGGSDHIDQGIEAKQFDLAT
jgi:hypothetical protein